MRWTRLHSEICPVNCWKRVLKSTFYRQNNYTPLDVVTHSERIVIDNNIIETTLTLEYSLGFIHIFMGSSSSSSSFLAMSAANAFRWLFDSTVGAVSGWWFTLQQIDQHRLAIANSNIHGLKFTGFKFVDCIIPENLLN